MKLRNTISAYYCDSSFSRKLRVFMWLLCLAEKLIFRLVGDVLCVCCVWRCYALFGLFVCECIVLMIKKSKKIGALEIVFVVRVMDESFAAIYNKVIYIEIKLITLFVAVRCCFQFCLPLWWSLIYTYCA